ncbi:MAG: hypothetical protein J6T39_02320 [Clostridia bacterium]|nr:hypothetical protein [Clostridia bacterium]
MEQMQPVIKNVGKYKLLKPVKGLALETFDKVNRSGETGVSTEKFGGVWFLTPQGKVLFKNYDVENDGMRIINELLYDELAGQIGLSVAKYVPAHYKSYPLHYLLRVDKDSIPKPEPEKVHFGLASVKVTKSKERILDAGELLDYDWSYDFNETFVDYMKALNVFQDGEGYYIDKRGIKSTLCKMMILDALTFMEDRNYHNVSFIRNNIDGYLIASPVIDNEMCFAGKNLWYDHNKKLETDVDLKTFLEAHSKEIRLVVNDDVRKAPLANRYIENVKAIVELAAKSKNLQKFLTKSLEEINIDTALKNVENMGYEITPEYKQYVKNLMKISKGIFKECINDFEKTTKTDEEVKESAK